MEHGATMRDADTGAAVPEDAALKELQAALRQLDVSDGYARDNRVGPEWVSIWEIQNSHVRDYINAALRARASA